MFLRKHLYNCLLQHYIQQKQKWRDAALDDSVERNESSISAESEEMSKTQQSHPITKAEREDNHHYAELADWKSKVRKQRQELYVIFQSISSFHLIIGCIVNCGTIDKKVISREK